MRKKRYSVSMLMLLLCGMIVLTSCSAITAQKITLNGAGGGMNGGLNGGNRNSMRGMLNADLIGKVVSVDGTKITIDVMEQAQRRSPASTDNSPTLTSPTLTTTPHSNARPNTDTPGTDNTPPTGRSGDGTSTMSSTGVTKTITITQGVTISQITAIMPQTNNNSTASTLKMTDLKAGQILMIWYKDNTNTVEKIKIISNY